MVLGKTKACVGGISATNKKCVSKSSDSRTLFSQGQPFSSPREKEKKSCPSMDSYGGRGQLSTSRTGQRIGVLHDQQPIILSCSAKMTHQGLTRKPYLWLEWTHFSLGVDYEVQN